MPLKIYAVAYVQYLGAQISSIVDRVILSSLTPGQTTYEQVIFSKSSLELGYQAGAKSVVLEQHIL